MMGVTKALDCGIIGKSDGIGGMSMSYTSDGFATLLLTMALSPNREEYARPYSTQEYYRLEKRVHGSSFRGIGELMGVDIGGLMLRLNISEEEGYRIFTLLNRSVQMGYTIENFLNRGIEVVTRYNDGYPKCLTKRMKEAAPPFLYRTGNTALIGQPAISIVGISGVKTTPEVRDGIVSLVKKASRQGYAVITGGELGVSRVAAGAVLEHGGNLIDVLGGGMYEHLNYEPIDALMKENRVAVLSMEHPEAMFTVSHAIARNKVIFAMSDASFICNTDNKRGETDALHNRYCDWIYAWNGYPANGSLISKGAMPVSDLRKFDFEDMCRHWRGSKSEQLNMFDII